MKSKERNLIPETQSTENQEEKMTKTLGKRILTPS
jgi:hypothetical protein